MSTVIAFPPPESAGRLTARGRRARRAPDPGQEADIVILPVVRIERHPDAPSDHPDAPSDYPGRRGASRH